MYIRHFKNGIVLRKYKRFVTSLLIETVEWKTVS